MADFAVGRTRLEHSLLAVRSTVGVHAPDLGALSTEVLKLGREGRIPLVNLLRNFRGDVFSPVAGELVAAGNDLAGSLGEFTAVFDVVGTTDEPLIDEAVLRTRRAHHDEDVVSVNAFRKSTALRLVKRTLQVALNHRFRHFFREADDLVVTRTFPLFVLGRVAFAALLRADEVVRQIEEGFVREAVRHSNLAAGVLGVLVAAAEVNPLFLAVGHRELTNDAAFLEVLEVGVIGLEVVPESLVLSDVAIEGAGGQPKSGQRGCQRPWRWKPRTQRSCTQRETEACVAWSFLAPRGSL